MESIIHVVTTLDADALATTRIISSRPMDVLNMAVVVLQRT